MKSISIAIIRHSVTEWNEEGRIQGHLDSPLTKHGRELASGWKEALNPATFDAVITSDLGRTIETAGIITEGLDLPALRLPGLREQDWGEWSGLTLDELNVKFPGKLDAEVAKGWNFRPNNGESRHETSIRAIESLEKGIHEIAEIVDKENPKVLAVVHEGVLKTIIYKLAGHDFMNDKPKMVKRRRLHWLKWNGTLSIDRLNENL
ncbi:histidine phosphatase family protein [Maridesulfovibrio hydrothermalis]|uniref:Phosphoglycerate mutase n=1 Tax=Maridesulfovibrio hydrothermalis AM13 = DSM 14728 TaxID=1121451 RepID=L0RES9_9BACT|nr:histidine phosphatase family protein [Maridesulfovibrio hydrothermalis]CCO24700.1 Phosphoglycerate mutase [Maridesulfovibrio hydrothermalis AM13 = DSM 14728]